MEVGKMSEKTSEREDYIKDLATSIHALLRKSKKVDLHLGNDENIFYFLKAITYLREDADNFKIVCTVFRNASRTVISRQTYLLDEDVHEFICDVEDQKEKEGLLLDKVVVKYKNKYFTLHANRKKPLPNPRANQQTIVRYLEN